MVMSAIHSVWTSALYYILCLVMDWLIFLVIDLLCKLLLTHCSTVSEKRDIWLWESLALFGLSMVVLTYHHLPLLLWGFGVVTFISATLTGRVNSGYYWESLKSYWREFSDQEDGMQPAFGNSTGPKSNSELTYRNQVSEDQYREYLRQSGDINIASRKAGSASSIGEGLKALRYNEQKAKYELVVPPSNMTTKRKDGGTTANIRHRASHKLSNIVTSVSPPSQARSTSNVLNNLEEFGYKVWGMLGLSNAIATRTELPPGLGGSRNNLCFFNSVLQCLARAPNLADELAEEVKSCRLHDNNILALLDAVAETLQQLNVMPSENTTPVVDTASLCQAGSQVNPDLLGDEHQAQLQQDACEFLTWILHELHDAVNDAKNGKDRNYHDESMSKLKAVYANISESYAMVMKRGCKDQIAAANGISDPALAESVQNLSNLEWISHRRTNRSVVDDLFTFQSIELQMCSNCNNTSANVQSMNVLPIPIRQQNDEIPLLGCIQTFIARERLAGRERLQCDKCQQNARESFAALSTPQTRSKNALDHVQSQMVSAPSPIQPQLRSTESNKFLASTPIAATRVEQRASSLGAALSNKVLTEGIRQCFLRRLPECLTLQLLRFYYDSTVNKACKIRTPIAVPLHGLDLTAVTYDSVVDRDDMTGISKSHLYSLYAITVHIGGDNTSSGHYLSFCKAVDGNWYKFDDEKVLLIRDIEEELKRPLISENCYLLFYKKQHDHLS